MTERRVVVVDGSNLATEGRTTPSLQQLDEAVRAYAQEDPDAEIVVVVDASFEHRVDASERAALEEAELHGEVVSPPAGAVGRGDAFVLRIAERTGATVLSNDSFQEFHAEHPWLFDDGRLMGGKPVPGVGWIFTPRIPVRGPKSRQATAKARRGGKAAEPLSPPVKAAELAKAARKAAAKRMAVLPDGSTPKVGDVWREPAPAPATPAEVPTTPVEAPTAPAEQVDNGAAVGTAPGGGSGRRRKAAGVTEKTAKKAARGQKAAKGTVAAEAPAEGGTVPAPVGEHAAATKATRAARATKASKKAAKAAKKVPAAARPSAAEPEAGAHTAGAAPVPQAYELVEGPGATEETAATAPAGTAKKAPAKRAAAKKTVEKAATKATRAAATEAAPAADTGRAAGEVRAEGERRGEGAGRPSRRARLREDAALRHAIDEATAEALSPPASTAGPERGGAGAPDDGADGAGGGEDGGDGKGRRRRRRAAAPPPAANEPLAFITFVASFPVGNEVEGEVVSFTSHGAMVDVDLPDGGALHCYIPLSAMADPPPTKARQVLSRGERRKFVLVGLDPPRRVAELAVPGVPAAAPEPAPAAG